MITEDYFRDRLKELADIESIATEKRIEGIYRILFLSATLFGILISLAPNSPHTLLVRLCFAVSMVSLALGIRLLSVSLYSLYRLYRAAANRASQELQKAIHEWRKPAYRAATQKGFFVFCEKVAYVCLLLSAVVLACYKVFSLSLCITC